jgi:type II secretory pathway pseudopilin PulG
MSRYAQSIRQFVGSATGLSTLELVISVGIMSIAMAATSGLFLAGRNFMRDQTLELETTQAARATIDMMLRELRLGGACLPVTGDFVSLDGTNVSGKDTIISRTGLTRPDLSCIRSATPSNVAANATVIPVQNATGFLVGKRSYIRHPAGTGEFVNIQSINTTTNELTINPGVSIAYPATSGVYEIDERSFSINNSDPLHPLLEMQIDGKAPASKMATNIERLNIQYQLHRNCPNCDVVDLPATEPEWAIVEQVFVEVTARSDRPGPAGDYYRRTLRVGVKPRNLLPRG